MTSSTSQQLSRSALPVFSVSARATLSRSRSRRSAVRLRSATRSPTGLRGQSPASNARRAAAIARWTSASSATSTCVTTVASLGLTTSWVAPDAGDVHSPSMKRLGTGPSLGAEWSAGWWRRDAASTAGPTSRSGGLGGRCHGRRTNPPSAWPTEPGTRDTLAPKPADGPSARPGGFPRMSPLPDRARVVVIGAGIVGNSMAWHLARLGWRDIVLLEKGTLPNPGGSTGHASQLHLPDRPLQGDDRVHARQRPPVPRARRLRRDRRHRGRPDARADGGAEAPDRLVARRGASRARAS